MTASATFSKSSGRTSTGSSSTSASNNVVISVRDSTLTLGGLSGGGDLVTGKCAGVGTLGPNGAASYRGAVYFWTASPKFARLNTVAGVFEYASDAQGNTHSKTWEWK